MSESKQIYTYRCGRKVPLKKDPNQFVIRTQPEFLETMGFEETEQVSGSSIRVTTTSDQLEPSMGMFRHIAPTHHAYRKEETGEEFLITDRILVTFRHGTTEDQVDRFAADYALVKRKKYSERDYLFQLTTHTGMNPVKLVVELSEDEEMVELVEHDLNQRLEKYSLPIPADPYYARQWHLHERLSHPQFDSRADARCEEAWRLLDSFGSPDVVVGFTDDGCLLNHPDFDSQAKFAGWAYFDRNRLIHNNDFDARPERMYQVGANHGTAVGGVIAGEVDATHTVGAAPGCRILPVKWESSGPSLLISDSKLLDALEYLQDKVDIISNSWGASPVSEWSMQVLDRIRRLAQNGGRRGKGILFLWAAGNENCPIEHNADINIPYTTGWRFYQDGSREWIGVRTSRTFRHNLVGLPGVMHIAAMASTAQRSHYSNYGPGISLCAPSSNGHTYGRMAVEGLGIITATGQPGGITFTFGGTSSATPLVAGIAGLVISANPSLSALEILSILQQTANKDLSFEGYPQTPPAPFDPNTGWDVSPAPPFDDGDFREDVSDDGSWSPWFGHGCVDALAAVGRALGSTGEEPPEETAFLKSSAPGMAIPDNDIDGVVDTLDCPVPGKLSFIRVKVNITHTYIGDLIVSLIAPSGKVAILHERNGGSANDLQMTYTPASAPTLSALLGESIEGPWKLQVQDLANLDTGTFNNWELELKASESKEIVALQEESVIIPDNDPQGAESRLRIEETGAIESIEVEVDITHTYIGDLRVLLTSPEGTDVILHERSGGSADNIIRHYTMDNTEGLTALRGESIQGEWTLQVVDLANLDRGKVNMWGVRVVTR